MKQHIYLQRIESIFVFLASTYIYFSLHFGILAYVLLLFIFDISMIGYAKSTTVGATIYNMAHSYALPIVVVTMTYALNIRLLLALGLLWLAHVGFDRALGYGLKLTTGFNHTHLGTIGKP